MEYIKSRDTLTSRLGTGPSVNQETMNFCAPNSVLCLPHVTGEKESEIVEHNNILWLLILAHWSGSLWSST